MGNDNLSFRSHPWPTPLQEGSLDAVMAKTLTQQKDASNQGIKARQEG